MQYLVTIITRFLVKGINLVTFLILARNLSLQDFSMYGYIFNFSLLIAVFFDLGLRNSSAYFIGKEEYNAKFIVEDLFKYLVISFPVFILIVVALMYFLSDIRSEYSFYIPIIAISLGLSYIRTLQGVFLGLSKIGLVNKSEIVQKSILFILVVIILVLGNMSIVNVLIAFSLSVFISTIYIFFNILRLVRIEHLSLFKFNKYDMFKRGGIFMFGALFMMTYKKVGFYIIDYIDGNELSGIYFGVNRLSEVITEVCLAIAMVLFAKNVKNKSRGNKIKNTAKVVRISFTSLTFIAVFMMFFAEFFITFMLGEKFLAGVELFRYCVLATVMGVLPTILFPVLTVLYSTLLISFLYGLAVIFNLVFALILYSSLGAVGVSLVLLTSNFLLVVLILSVIKKKETVSVFDFILIKKSDLQNLSRLFKQKIR